MRAAGVSNDRAVVVYDGTGGLSAARAWWLLRHYGHRDVAVLDGGLAAWTSAGQPLELGAGDAPKPGDFSGRPGVMPILDASGAASLARHGVLLDARAAERFRGESEPVDRVPGHIPGARCRPTTANLAPDCRFLSRSQLRSEFADASRSRSRRPSRGRSWGRRRDRRLLRLGGDRGPSGAGPRAGGPPGRALSGIVE
jgi:thiosulfate/3-mercaptopyruvate sulfurtransferase